MASYLAALERVMAGVVQYGDVLLPARERRTEARAAYGAAVRALEDVRGLLPGSAALGAERALLDYTTAVVTALAAWLRTGAVADGDALLADAIGRMAAGDPAVIGTWGAHDLELTHGFFANARRES
jgi:hypothetical protein